MVRLFALGAYGVQSLAAVAAVLAAGAILPASEYGAYSLAVATVQTAAIVAFEWLRLAASRLVGGGEAPERAVRLASVRFAFAASAVPVLLLLPAAGLVFAGPAFSPVGALAAILLAFADLRITLIRYRGDLVGSAVLQILRSLLLLVGVIAGARFGTAHAAFVGLAAAYAGAALATAAADREGFGNGRWRASREALGELLRYGGPAALASGIHLLIPLSLRWALSAAADPIRFAGIALAIDLLQRPFAIAFTALTGIFLPGAFAERDRADGAAHARTRLRRAHLVGGTAVLAATFAAFPTVAALVVDTPLRPGFVVAAPAAILFFAGHGWLQNSVAIPAMLARDGGALVRNAALEAGFALAAVLLAWFASGGEPVEMLWSAAAGVALGLACGARSAARASAREPGDAAKRRLRSQ